MIPMTCKLTILIALLGLCRFSYADAPNQNASSTQDLFKTFQDPPREFSLIPFWFLNDDLDETEIKRQLDDFADHGVYGVVPHPRLGLPDEIGWMSDRWLHYLEYIVDYCASKGMTVILYDEAMYPSGSCAGQVVAANPLHATRSIVRRSQPDLKEDEVLVAQDDQYYYVNARSGGHIRGVHFGTDDGDPGAPPSADILNPEAVASFLHLTHDKHKEILGKHFGKTITAVFTDEPDMLGRGARRGTRPWTWDFEVYLTKFLGYDFRPHLAALWDENYPEAPRYVADFDRAVNARLEASYYAPYSAWCRENGLLLTGHPAGPMDIGTLKHFQLPGQDVVWRYLEPFEEKSIEGPQSTMGKSSASAQVHYGRSRNLNECFGAYGWDFTYQEMRWVTNWLLVRGVNLLSPHAYYYSLRGARRDERPPDVGPNSPWWPDYKTYADYCRRLSWLLAEGEQQCSVAILGTPTYLPWGAARILFEHQWDFNYVDTDTLIHTAQVNADSISINSMRYTTLIVDGPEAVSPKILKALQPLIDAGRVVVYGEPLPGLDLTAYDGGALLSHLAERETADVNLTPPEPNARYHHVQHGGEEVYFFTNEGPEPIDVALHVSATGKRAWWNPENGAVMTNATTARLQLPPYTGRVLVVTPQQDAPE
jgi:hypothetical protein